MKKLRIAKALVLAGLLGVSLAACSEKKVENKTEQVTQEMKAGYEEFKSEMNAKLDSLDKKIETLEEKMKSESVDAKEDLKEKVSELKEMREDLSDELGDLADTTEDKYVDMKLAVEHKYEELETDVEKMFNQVKGPPFGGFPILREENMDTYNIVIDGDWMFDEGEISSFPIVDFEDFFEQEFFDE